MEKEEVKSDAGDFQLEVFLKNISTGDVFHYDVLFGNILCDLKYLLSRIEDLEKRLE